MTSLYPLIFLIIAVNTGFAQHCQYDHSELIGVRPMNLQNEIIEGLKITMVDENGKPIIVRKELYQGDDKYIGYKNDTAKFWRNPKPNKDIVHKKRNEESRHFIQAETDYIIITNSKGRSEKGRYIKIEDLDGDANGGHFYSKIVYVKPDQIQSLCGYPDEKNFIGQYQPVQVKLDLYDEIKRIYYNTKTVAHFKFELELKFIKAKTDLELDHYIREIRVKNTLNDKLIYSSSMNAKNADIRNRSYCTDSIEVADYNFDGFPDFRSCNLSYKYTYMVFDRDGNTFVQEPLLNKMDDIEFNFNQKNLIGDLLIFDKKDKNLSGMYPNNDYLKSQSRYFVFGSGLQYVKEFYKQYNHTSAGLKADEKIIYYKYEKYKLIPIEESVYKAHEDIITNNSISTLRTPFKFILEKNCPGVELPAEKGFYANRISVYNLKNNELIYSMVAVGNKLKETSGCSDSMQIADYNFDGYPDFRVCNNSVAGKHTYYLYHKKRNTFVIENTLTELYSLQFDFENKTAKGNTDRKEYPGYPWNSPYQYYLENLIFDGFEDFRQQSKISPYFWDVFIYNPSKEAFVKDTLLSKFEIFDYNKIEKKLEGCYRYKLDNLTIKTDYYKWSTAENKMMFYQTQTCYSEFPGSEIMRCVISKLVNGKWIEIEQIRIE